jgi:hypothetical protein
MGAKLKSKTHLLNTLFDFLSCFLRVWLQSYFFWKIEKGVKNTEFHADFESVEKVVKKCSKKGYKQNKFDEHE